MGLWNIGRQCGEFNSRIAQEFLTTRRTRSQDQHAERFYRKLSLNEFNAVAEHVVDVATQGVGDGTIRRDFYSSLSQLGNKSGVIFAAQRGMSFFRRAEVSFDAQVDLHISAGEPASAALGEYGRLGNFLHAQHIAVKTAGFGFFSFWHGKLDVVERVEWSAI